MQSLSVSLLLVFISLISPCLTLAQSPVPVEPGSVLILGGSFDPPTIEHTGLVLRLMEYFEISEGRMRVAKPYKPDASSAEVSTTLTQVAVEHSSEVLDLLGMLYDEYTSQNGVAHWKNQNGDTRKLSADLSEIRLGTTQTEDSLRALSRENRGPKKVFWISGGDSFASIPTWKYELDDTWKVLDYANWVVVARPGFDQGPRQVKFSSPNPLQVVLPATLLSQYTHTFDAGAGIHIYSHTDPSKPSIFVVDQPLRGGNHELAETALAPSVFTKIIEQGYYVDANQERVFTTSNLVRLLNHMLSVDKFTPEDKEAFRMLADILVSYAETVAQAERDKPVAMAILIKAFENVVEVLKVWEYIPRLRNTFIDAVRKYGIRFAAIFVGLELIEQTVQPFILYHLGGPAALGLQPFIHQEFVSIPVFLGYQYFTSQRQAWRLADPTRWLGDSALYDKIADASNRYLQGDPRLVQAQVEVRRGLRMGDEPMILNIVKSRLPKWVPLRIRQWDDSRVRWYDLNISTNELKAILRNDSLADGLMSMAEADLELYSRLLLVAVLRDENARLRLDIFVGARYFGRLYLGEIPIEYLETLNAEERAWVEKTRSLGARLRQEINPDELKRFQNFISTLYALVRILRQDSALAINSAFWASILNHYVKGYPDLEISLESESDLTKLAEFFLFLAPILEERLPFLKGIEVRLGNSTLVTLEKDMIFTHEGLRRSAEAIRTRSSTSISLTRMRDTLDYFLKNTPNIFVLGFTDSQLGTSPSDLVSSHATARVPDDVLRPDTMFANNLAQQIQVLLATHRRADERFKEAFELGLTLLKSRSLGSELERIFVQAWDKLLKKETDVEHRLHLLSFAYVKYKFAFPFESEDHAGSEQIAGLRAEYAELRSELDRWHRAQSSLIQMMNGTVRVDLTDTDALKKQIGVLIDVNPSSLGLGWVRLFCNDLLTGR